MRKQRGNSIFIAIILVIILSTIFPSSIAYADEPCDALIVDEARVFGAGISRVEDAAYELENLGADLRVRTIPSFGSSGNLDNYAIQVERRCASWQAPDGSRKNNLLVFIISVSERKTGIYYGSQWKNALDNQWLRIQTDFMNPRFKDGDFAAGFVNGMRETRRLLDDYLHPQTSVKPTTAPTTVQPVPPSTQKSGSGAGMVFLVIGLVALGGLGGLLGFRALSSRRKKETLRRQTRDRALEAERLAFSRMTETSDRVKAVEDRLYTIAPTVSRNDIQPILEFLEKLKTNADSAAQEYGEIKSRAGDLTRSKLGHTTLESIEKEYLQIAGKLEELGKNLENCQSQVEEIEQLRSEVPKMVEKTSSLIHQTIEKLQTAKEMGFKLDSSWERAAVSLQESVEQAKVHVQDGEYRRASQMLNEAQDQISKIQKAAEDLPKLREEAEASLKNLTERIPGVKQKIEHGREIFERIRLNFPQSCWESIQGNGTEAEKRVEWSSKTITAVQPLITMEEQKWNEALKVLTEAHAWLDQAESVMRSIVALEENLLIAKQDSPKEIEAAEADIAKAWDYIRRHDEDIREELEDELLKVEGKVNLAKEELKSTLPDYLRVLQLAKEANETADKILSQARSEHEAAERLRQKAVSSLRDARAAASKAREYIEDHSYDVGSTAEHDLADARRYLKEAETSQDLQTKISLAQKAEAEANRAYNQARSDVDDAERRRYEEERRRREIIVIDSSHHHDHSGGGSGNGGGISIGGGGSTGWGGGGGGGGGSSSW